VLFNVKGTCNNVATGFLLGRSRDRGIPEVIVRSVQDLRTDRSAGVMVNDFTSEVENLPQSGPPQRSPLAPILFPFFFNADLVQSNLPGPGDSALICRRMQLRKPTWRQEGSIIICKLCDNDYCNTYKNSNINYICEMNRNGLPRMGRRTFLGCLRSLTVWKADLNVEGLWYLEH
jgi:hypothetical protein